MLQDELRIYGDVASLVDRAVNRRESDEVETTTAGCFSFVSSTPSLEVAFDFEARSERVSPQVE